MGQIKFKGEIGLNVKSETKNMAGATGSHARSPRSNNQRSRISSCIFRWSALVVTVAAGPVCLIVAFVPVCNLYTSCVRPTTVCYTAHISDRLCSQCYADNIVFHNFRNKYATTQKFSKHTIQSHCKGIALKLPFRLTKNFTLFIQIMPKQLI